MTQQHIIFLVLAVLAVALLRLLGGRSGIGRLPVRPRELMTKRERIVCGFIEQAIPSARVHAQVSMGAILQPARGLDRSRATSVRNRFSSKRVDFLLEDRASGDIIAIELRVVDDQLSEIWFEAEGCELSQATVSMLCEQLEQKQIDDVKNLSPNQAFQLLGLTVSGDQHECCRIGLAGIQSALDSPIDDDMHDPTFTNPNLGDEC